MNQKQFVKPFTIFPENGQKLEKSNWDLQPVAGEIPDKGIVSIFLPTEQLTGVSAAHINAPFYGDISRTFVDFSHPYNDLLVGEIAKKAVYNPEASCLQRH